MKFIDRVASVSRADNQTPDEQSIGRECHAFSKQEDAAFDIAEETARSILDGLIEDVDFEIERDAIGNLYIRFKGTNPNAKAVLTGFPSRLSREWRKYDGVAGVAMALQTLSVLVKQFEKPAQDFVVAV